MFMDNFRAPAGRGLHFSFKVARREVKLVGTKVYLCGSHRKHNCTIVFGGQLALPFAEYGRVVKEAIVWCGGAATKASTDKVGDGSTTASPHFDTFDYQCPGGCFRNETEKFR